MDGFEKVSITDAMEADNEEACTSKSTKIVDVLRSFLAVQQRRAEAYAKLRRYGLSFSYRYAKFLAKGFNEYMVGGGDSAYQQLCGEITQEFNDCSKQVLEMESLFSKPDLSRDDLSRLLRSVQTHEKQKLHLTVTIQVLKKAGRPSERLVSHEHCKFKKPAEHECAHVREITVASGTEEAEADVEYDNALKEAIKGVQDAVTSINEHLEEVRYEIEALEAE
ncbi:hypothetical protein Scep_024397 [Stephania cephalantha]|uniref:Uncharacterized protein n=1 Tax=Stephania cephalantha TaxID=152367 RepID=A0AAP0F1Y4_9MAGN